MSNTTNQSDLQKAVENVNPENLAQNLTDKSGTAEKPDNLNTQQTTPFIDENVRTDK